MSAVIQTRNLTKAFADFDAVKDVTLTVEPGEIYGFLGPNGAGKTTTIMLLLGLLPPTRGEARVFERPAAVRDFDTRRRIGVVGEQQAFYDDMSAREHLRFFGRLYRVADAETRTAQLLERFHLSPAADARAADFSRGMKQKLGFARALLHDPDLLILDEPVSALDPRGVVEIREALLEETRRGKTVFISSHLLTEVEQLAHRIGIMNKGQLIVEDSLDNVKRQLQPEVRLRIELTASPAPMLPRLTELSGVTSLEVAETYLSLSLKATDLAAAKARVSRAIVEAGGVIIDMQTEEMSLEEAFVAITDQNVAQLAAP